MMDRPAGILEEKLASLFQPDVLISAQYFDTLRSKNGLEPEKRLLLAVLEDAVRCYQDNLAAESDTKRKLFDEAEEWFLEEGVDAAFSFESICDALDLNPEYVRRGLSGIGRRALGFKNACDISATCRQMGQPPFRV